MMSLEQMRAELQRRIVAADRTAREAPEQGLGNVALVVAMATAARDAYAAALQMLDEPTAAPPAQCPATYSPNPADPGLLCCRLFGGHKGAH